MEQITLSKSDATSLYNVSTDAGKEYLEQKFGKAFFNQKIEDRIQSFEDACNINGVDPWDVLPYADPTTADQKSIQAYAKLIQIVRAFNQGQVPDWKNSSQYKYRPWFYMNNPSGSGLSFDDYGGGSSHTTVASRLHFFNSEHVAIAAKRFHSIYEDFMIESN